MRRVQYIDVDDEVGRDYGKRKTENGSRDCRFQNEDCELAEMEVYFEDYVKDLKED